MAENGEKVEDMLHGLESIVHELHSLGVVVEDFQSNSQPVLFEKLNAYVKHLGELNRTRTAVAGTKVPEKILQFLDEPDNNNPELFTKAKLKECANASDAMSHRKDALLLLKSQLQEGLEKVEDNVQNIEENDSAMIVDK